MYFKKLSSQLNVNVKSALNQNKMSHSTSRTSSTKVSIQPFTTATSTDLFQVHLQNQSLIITKTI